ncbi:hypothetical protein PF010_g22440 [Phytophthora fragariae]|uniref:Uncharacterized protein n=1 Tax=Phytophthora fragariae TaxID=53985 RepID=A0A6G0K8W8_9STRA|nr:hypothetical protein PF010_g22440 [Phytophthora fragariae]
MNRRYALDADVDVDMTVAQPIYEFIAASRLKSCGITKFFAFKATTFSPSRS